MPLSRRAFLYAGAMSLTAAGANASLPLAGMVFEADASTDQTAALQAAINEAAASSGYLFLPAGRYRTSTLHLPSGLMLSGVPGASILSHIGSDALLFAANEANIVLSGLTIEGSGAGGERWHGGLVHMEETSNVAIQDCTITGTGLNAITLMNSSGVVDNCLIAETEATGIFVRNARGVRLVGNSISRCGNGGIRIWRGESGHDGTIVSDNRISQIDWRDGGNGQNGNGINVFQADAVIVSGNVITDCAFSAIRLNATNNTHVVGNSCLNSGEVAIFSEFSFTGSVIANNIIDGAAAGISITNFNDGGRLASCTGNIVRNLVAGSATNPDLQQPYGIAAQADAVISGNVVDNVAGDGIAAGWGPYLRDVSVTGNLVRDVSIGVNVSVASGAGSATVSGNTISGARTHAIAGSAWWDIVSADLANDAARYPQVAISDNVIS